MIEAPIKHELQTLKGNVDARMHILAREAKPIQNLSDIDDKLVQVVMDANGNKAVRRVYGPDTLESFNLKSDSFETAWNKMNKTFTQAGVEVVPSFVLTSRSSGAIVISNFLEDARDIKYAPTEKKEKFAESLGKLSRPQSNDFFPDIKMFSASSFQTTRGEDGKDKIVLTGVDPYANFIPGAELMDSLPQLKDHTWGRYLEYMTEMLDNFWTLPEEKNIVLGGLIKGAIEGLRKEPNSKDFMNTIYAIQTADILRQGIDIERHHSPIFK